MMFALRYIEAHPGATQSEILSTEGTRISSKQRSLMELERLGMIRREPGRGNCVHYYLNDSGRKTAEILDAIAEILARRMPPTED
ncbi:MAG: hypothetical protein Q4Q58_06215 [Thermoplasmata archaeon]|nr:hypothetical protein [Thermoplasmata archaeon]